MRRTVFVTIAACAMLLSTPHYAAEGLQTRHPAVVYDGPSQKARAKFILPGGYFLSPISRVHRWRKVVTHSGEKVWLEEADLRGGQGAIVTAERGAVRARPAASAETVFFAQRGVMMQAIKVESGWVQVVHPDGESGYILATEVWLNNF